MLTERIIKGAENSDVVKAQIASPDVDVLTGLPFKATTGKLSAQQKKAEFLSYVAGINKNDKKADVYIDIQCILAEELQLEAGVEEAFKNPMMQNKDVLIAMIAKSLAEEMGVSSEMVTEQLSELELSELHAMMRPAIEEQVKARIRAAVEAGFAQFTDDQLAAMLDDDLTTDKYTEAQYASFYDEITVFSDSTYEENLITIGSVELDSPASINLYASSFENKDVIVATIDSYNASVGEAQKLAYTDLLGIMMSSITTIINAISYVLIAFVSISLVVSSIMIGVITLISVQERTKEIGILRAIGASKRDVSSMFNAETMIIGFASGALGVGVTYLLCIPINLILNFLTGLGNLKAVLPIPAALILVAISVALTLIAGIIPSRSAAKKDPVVALRSE
jgi:putative ABC transport system permease protein